MTKHFLMTRLRWFVGLLAMAWWATAALPAPAEPTTPTFNTIITIDSSDDPDNLLSRTCTYSSGGTGIPAPDGRCTLRRRHYRSLATGRRKTAPSKLSLPSPTTTPTVTETRWTHGQSSWKTSSPPSKRRAF